MIRAGAVWAIRQGAALGVALAAPTIALAMIGEVFASAPAAAALQPPGEVFARVAPLARGERLMTFDVALELVRVTVPVLSAEPLTAAAEELALAPATAVVPEPAPEPEKPDPTPSPPAPPPPPAAAPPVTTSLTTQQAELRMLALMNTSRLQAGLAPLALDATVSDAARLHSAVEAQYRYVYHDGPDGTARSRYVPACGTGWYGENTGKVWSGGVEVLHREFMAEPWVPINHRTNIMDPNFRRAGIGAVVGPDALYITIAFCR